MPEAEEPVLDALRNTLGEVAGEFSHLASLRWRLAELELRDSARSAKRLTLWGGVSAAMLLVSLAVLATAAAAWLDAVRPLGKMPWAWIIGPAMAVAGSTVGWLAWRRFRREFRGLEQSIDEIREDLVWLREWTGQREATDRE